MRTLDGRLKGNFLMKIQSSFKSFIKLAFLKGDIQTLTQGNHEPGSTDNKLVRGKNLWI